MIKPRRLVWGQVVIEVLIGVAIATVALLGLVQIATKSVSNSGFAKRQSVATAYAVEGMEWVKGRRRQEAWSEIYARNGTYCLNTLPASFSLLTGGNCGGATMAGTEYTRTVTFAPIVITPPAGGNQQATVNVVVSWSEGGRIVTARQETHFLR